MGEAVGLRGRQDRGCGASRSGALWTGMTGLMLWRCCDVLGGRRFRGKVELRVRAVESMGQFWAVAKAVRHGAGGGMVWVQRRYNGDLEL